MDGSRNAADLRVDLDGRTVGDQSPDLLVRNGDTALGPIVETMIGAERTLAVGEAVNHDVAARTDAQSPRTITVGIARVRNSQRAMEGAFRISTANGVDSFGRFSVALALAWVRQECGPRQPGRSVSPPRF